MSVVVLKPGLLTTVQDRGRYGMAALGIGHAGPVDSALFRLALALAGSDENAAALEISVIGPSLQFSRACRVALTGDFAQPRIDGREVGCWRPLQIDAGSTLECGPLRSGMRGYLAISGGIENAPVLGSRATDLNAVIGPIDGRALAAGDTFAIAESALKFSVQSNWSLDPSPWFNVDHGQPIHCVAGRHYESLADASMEALQRDCFTVSRDSNRVGIRLDGQALRLRETLERVSEPVTFGTVQLPAGGQPIVLMAEHPTTGGYPCIAQVCASDLGRLAQRRPGEPVRLAWLSMAQAQSRYLAREREVSNLIHAIGERT